MSGNFQDSLRYLLPDLAEEASWMLSYRQNWKVSRESLVSKGKWAWWGGISRRALVGFS